MLVLQNLDQQATKMQRHTVLRQGEAKRQTARQPRQWNKQQHHAANKQLADQR
ncbi:hypothetical protein [Serratia rubidaea]|uniref:hypothetical protein n=1 Tax=Serratia rubidaea TaxID=61652 RepID=UPI0013E3ADCE|nr:hypothetical protein [Serratia rubidaea]MBD8452441.1 hypothetical protein [Serratia rubidaea]MBS0974916.1 hypothetical protein [Serratia rubidaea]MDC6110185.1 hypothetical protein [Serratia rubidaea]